MWPQMFPQLYKIPIPLKTHLTGSVCSEQLPTVLCALWIFLMSIFTSTDREQCNVLLWTVVTVPPAAKNKYKFSYVPLSLGALNATVQPCTLLLFVSVVYFKCLNWPTVTLYVCMSFKCDWCMFVCCKPNCPPRDKFIKWSEVLPGVKRFSHLK